MRSVWFYSLNMRILAEYEKNLSLLRFGHRSEFLKVNGAISISELCDLRCTQLILYHYLLSLRLLPFLQENHTWP